MVYRLVDYGRKFGIEINIDKSQVMIVSRSNEPLQIKVNNGELKEVDHFKYLGKLKKNYIQDRVNTLVDSGKKYGMEINIDKTQVMRVSRSNESLQIKVNNRELKEVDHFKYL